MLQLKSGAVAASIASTASFRAVLLVLLLTSTHLQRAGAGAGGDGAGGGGGNILAIFQHYGYSHFLVYYPILRNLAERGHNLTVITYVKAPHPHPNYKELLLTGETLVNAFKFDNFDVGRTPKNLFDEYLALHDEGQRSCRKFYESSFVETVLAQHAIEPFDLVLTEYFNTDCHLGVPYLMDVPVVALSSCALMPWLYDRISLPDTPSYIQSEFIGFPDELNVYERLLNFIQMKFLKFSYRYYTNRKDNQLIKKYLNIDIDVYEEAKRMTNVIFVNQHYSLSGSRPMSPQLVEIGGVHITTDKMKSSNTSLPQNIGDFLAKAKPNQDVILISFGSLLRTSSFDANKMKAILKVLKQRNFKAIWKYEGDEIPLKSEEILFVKWLPQLHVLCHPKVKYFWGHGGLLSTTEALHCGKALIVTPIYGDQFLNAYAVQNRKIGVIFNYHDIDERNMEATLSELQRPRYTTKAQSLSKLFRERDISPLNKAVWYIEHILKHKNLAAEILQTKAMHLNFIIYHSLDSIAIILLCISVVIWLSMRCICSLKSMKRISKDFEGLETKKLLKKKK